MVLVRQLTTAGFRLISKYKYIVPRLSKCYGDLVEKRLRTTVLIQVLELVNNYISFLYLLTNMAF